MSSKFTQICEDKPLGRPCKQNGSTRLKYSDSLEPRPVIPKKKKGKRTIGYKPLGRKK
jgi:hypothetical protein